jgi:hypothetical protein
VFRPSTSVLAFDEEIGNALVSISSVKLCKNRTLLSYFRCGSEDVEDEVCLYTACGRALLEVAIQQMTDVVSKATPYFDACRHCENQDNFVDGMSACTLYCGSCVDEDCDASKLGVVSFNLSDVVIGTLEAAILNEGAGAALQCTLYRSKPISSI